MYIYKKAELIFDKFSFKKKMGKITKMETAILFD